LPLRFQAKQATKTSPLNHPPIQADVVVIGGGHAGMCAALTARQQGAHVVVLEKAPKYMRGGNTRHTRNLRAKHIESTATMTGAYTGDEYFHDIMQVTAGNTNKTLARLVVDQSEELMQWLVEQGVDFQPSLSGTLNLDRTNAFFLGGGCALLNILYLRAESLGIDIFYDTEVTHLAVDDHACQTLLGSHNNKSFELHPGAVVAACGGFQANGDWMRQIWGPAADNFLIRGTPYNQGQVLKNLLDQGAQAVGDPKQCHAVAIDARAPKFDGGIVTRLDCVCFSVVVNRQAQRFYDEGEDFWPKRYAIWGRLVAAQTDQIAYAIIDSKVANKFMPSIYPPLRADTLGELAQQTNLPEHQLQHTIDEFNQAVTSGTYDPTILDDCSTQGLSPNKSHWALKIDQPPFMAYPLKPGITFTYLGVAVDHLARVMFADDKHARNLFAAGEIMAGNILGQGYCAGTGMTIGGVFGRIAGYQATCHST